MNSRILSLMSKILAFLVLSFAHTAWGQTTSTLPCTEYLQKDSEKKKSLPELEKKLMSTFEILGTLQQFTDKNKEERELEARAALLNAEKSRLLGLENAIDPELQGGDSAILEAAVAIASPLRSLLEMNADGSSLTDAKRNSGRSIRQINKHQYPWILIKDGTKHRLEIVLSKEAKKTDRNTYKEALTGLNKLINSFSSYENSFVEIGNAIIILKFKMQAADRALQLPQVIEKLKTGQPVTIKFVDSFRVNEQTRQPEVLYRGVEFNNIQSLQAFRDGIQKFIAELPLEIQAGKMAMQQKYVDKYLLLQAIQLWKIEMIKELLDKYVKQVGGTNDHKRLLESATAAIEIGRSTLPKKYHHKAILNALKNEIFYSLRIQNKMTPDAQRLQSALDLHGISAPSDINPQVTYNSLSDLVKKHLKKLVLLTGTLRIDS